MLVEMLVFVIAALTWTSWAAYFQGKNGEPMLFSPDPEKATPLFTLAPPMFAVAFFVAALVGAPSLLCAAFLGLFFGGLLWLFGDGANFAGAMTRYSRRTQFVQTNQPPAPSTKTTSIDVN